MVSRNTEHQFADTNPEPLEALLVAGFERITGRALHPADPEKLYIQWVLSIILQERVLNNYTGNQNVPSRAEGENLDALAELAYVMERPGAEPACCTERFYISEPQQSAVLIPAGTRVTDTGSTLVWETIEDAVVEIGNTFADVRIRCQTPGIVGNGYAVGQINRLTDVFPYYNDHCENTTVSGGGSDRLDDDAFYNLMRASMDGYSTAGGVGNYIYHAMRTSSEIADVVPNSPTPGVVYIYVLMKGGEPAGEEMKTSVFNACNADYVRPMTDWVHMGDPEIVPYSIDFTYYLYESKTMGAAAIQTEVDAAVKEYVAWQSAKLGRDINPSVLIELLMKTGIKRVDLRQPVFTSLRDGKLDFEKVYEYPDTVPQLAKSVSVSVVNGGYEDE